MTIELLGLWVTVISGAATLLCLIVWAATGMKNRRLQQLAGVLMLVTLAGYFGPKYLG